jgi:hypothetical protein
MNENLVFIGLISGLLYYILNKKQEENDEGSKRISEDSASSKADKMPVGIKQITVRTTPATKKEEPRQEVYGNETVQRRTSSSVSLDTNDEILEFPKPKVNDRLKLQPVKELGTGPESAGSGLSVLKAKRSSYSSSPAIPSPLKASFSFEDQIPQPQDSRKRNSTLQSLKTPQDGQGSQVESEAVRRETEKETNVNSIPRKKKDVLGKKKKISDKNVLRESNKNFTQAIGEISKNPKKVTDIVSHVAKPQNDKVTFAPAKEEINDNKKRKYNDQEEDEDIYWIGPNPNEKRMKLDEESIVRRRIEYFKVIL